MLLSIIEMAWLMANNTSVTRLPGIVFCYRIIRLMVTKTDTFAVIETGGKQYQVTAGDSIKIEILPEALKEGDTVVFDKVLLVDTGSDTKVGDPYLSGAKVEGTLKREGRAGKIEILRRKAKSNRMRRQGHRQPFMEVEITGIK